MRTKGYTNAQEGVKVSSVTNANRSFVANETVTDVLCAAIQRADRSPHRKSATVIQFALWKAQALAAVAREMEWKRAKRSPLRVAVKAAIEAYEESGRMMDAALAYARHGFPIFPLDPKDKSPIPPRDEDEHGNKVDGTGSFYKQSVNEHQIRKWWRRTPNALIAMQGGESTGVWMLDIDTASEDHDDDGVAAWNEIAAKHDPFKTREHRSGSGGPHLFFEWDPEHPIGCSKGDLPKGIDVKGHGGYVVMPPSRRKGRSYTVFAGHDIDPIKPPKWLLDLIPQKADVEPTDRGKTFIYDQSRTEAQNLNDEAMCNLDLWMPKLFPKPQEPRKGWYISEAKKTSGGYEVIMKRGLPNNERLSADFRASRISACMTWAIHAEESGRRLIWSWSGTPISRPPRRSWPSVSAVRSLKKLSLG